MPGHRQSTICSPVPRPYLDAEISAIFLHDQIGISGWAESPVYFESLIQQIGTRPQFADGTYGTRTQVRILGWVLCPSLPILEHSLAIIRTEIMITP
jgi:hypothetical protein